MGLHVHCRLKVDTNEIELHGPQKWVQEQVDFFIDTFTDAGYGPDDTDEEEFDELPLD